MTKIVALVYLRHVLPVWGREFYPKGIVSRGVMSGHLFSSSYLRRGSLVMRCQADVWSVCVTGRLTSILQLDRVNACLFPGRRLLRLVGAHSLRSLLCIN